MCISADQNGARLIKMAREEIGLQPRSKVILRHAQQDFDTISSEVFLFSLFLACQGKPLLSGLVSAPFPSGKCNSFVVIYMTYQKPHVWFPPQSKAAYVLFYQRRRSHRVSVLSDKGEGASSDVMAAADDDWVDEGEDEDMDTK